MQVMETSVQKTQEQIVMEYMFSVSKALDKAVYFTCSTLCLSCKVNHHSIRRIMQGLNKKGFITIGGLVGTYQPPTDKQMMKYIQHGMRKSSHRYVSNTEVVN